MVCVKTVNVTAAEPPETSVTLVGPTLAPGPPDTLGARVTVPLKPFRLVTVTTDVPEEPDGKLKETGLGEMLNSGGAPTVTLTVTEWDSNPLVPITVTE